MEDHKNEMVRVYSDTEITINMLKAELAKIEIPSLVKNEFRSGLMAGFGAAPNAVDLFVDSENVEQAELLIRDLDLRKQ